MQREVGSAHACCRVLQMILQCEPDRARVHTGDRESKLFKCFPVTAGVLTALSVVTKRWFSYESSKMLKLFLSSGYRVNYLRFVAKDL